MAEFAGNEFGKVGVDDVARLHHLAFLHQVLDDVDGAFGHALRQFLNGDGLRQDHFAQTFSRVSCIWLRRNFSCRRRMASHRATAGIAVVVDAGSRSSACRLRRSSSVFGRAGALPVPGERRGHGPGAPRGACTIFLFVFAATANGRAAAPAAGRAKVLQAHAASGRCDVAGLAAAGGVGAASAAAGCGSAAGAAACLSLAGRLFGGEAGFASSASAARR
jgi:hypothetical protein